MKIGNPKFRRRSYYKKERVRTDNMVLASYDGTIVKNIDRHGLITGDNTIPKDASVASVDLVFNKLVHDGDTWLCTVKVEGTTLIAYGVARKNKNDIRSKSVAKQVALGRANKVANDIKSCGPLKSYRFISKLYSEGFVSEDKISDLISAFNREDFYRR